MIDKKFKLGLLAGFALVVGYFVWPYWDPPPPGAQAETKLPFLEARWLNAKPGEGEGRDPFNLPDVKRSAGPAVAAGPKDPGTAGKSAEKSAAEAARAKREAELPPRPELALGAILVHGDRRAAILNGRIYRPGETLRLDGPNRDRWTLDRVAPDGVVVTEVPGPRTLRIRFPRPDARIVAGKEAAPAASPPLGTAEAQALAPGVLEQIAAESGGDVRAVYGKLWSIFLGLGSGNPPLAAGARTRAPGR